MNATRNDTTLGVILLNYKTYAETIRIVEDLRRQKDVALRIVVVDNCSPNESLPELRNALAHLPEVTVLSSPANGGYASGNNIGLEYLAASRPRFVAVMNNDIYFDDDRLLAKVAERYDHLEQPGFISPRQIDFHGKDAPVVKKITYWQDVFSSFFLFRLILPHLALSCKYDHSKTCEPVQIVPGSFLWIDFALFKSLGFFDPNTFLYGEERILAHKVNVAGYQNYILPDLAYRHVHALTIKNEITSFNRIRMYFTSVLYFETHYRKKGRVALQVLKISQQLGLWELRLILLIRRIIRK